VYLSELEKKGAPVRYDASVLDRFRDMPEMMGHLLGDLKKNWSELKLILSGSSIFFPV